MFLGAFFASPSGLGAVPAESKAQASERASIHLFRSNAKIVPEILKGPGLTGALAMRHHK